MGSPLGPTQLLVLDALACSHSDEAPTVRELVDWLNIGRLHGHPPTTTAATVGSSLRGLERRGYAERLGTSASGARCWAITSSGRVALTEAADR